MLLKKFLSVKNLLLLFVCSLISYIIFTNKNDWMPLAQNLSWCVLAYFPANVMQKKILFDKNILN